MDALRRTTLITVAACATVAAGLWLLFGVLLEPVREGCNTSLIDSPYATALVPAHLIAAAVLTAVLRRPRGVLIAVWVVIGVCLVYPGLFGLIGFAAVFAGPVIGIPALLALGIGAAVNAPRPDRWEKFATIATALAWGCLVLGLPASVAYAWLEGASAFCF